MDRVRLIILLTFWKTYLGGCDQTCLKLEVSITQRVDNEGFHRRLQWLIETTFPRSTPSEDSGCKMALRQTMSNGMFVNPDEVAELNRTGERGYACIECDEIVEIPQLIESATLCEDGEVDTEAPSHLANEHILYIYLKDSDIPRTSIDLPIHLRYQRGQITGGHGKVHLSKPSLLVRCPKSVDEICDGGLKVEAPCDQSAQNTCVWKNFTYQPLFEEAELFVPVGNLDDYPLVSIVTLLLGCAGCIYILSVLSVTPL